MSNDSTSRRLVKSAPGEERSKQGSGKKWAQRAATVGKVGLWGGLVVGAAMLGASLDGPAPDFGSGWSDGADWPVPDTWGDSTDDAAKKKRAALQNSGSEDGQDNQPNKYKEDLEKNFKTQMENGYAVFYDGSKKCFATAQDQQGSNWSYVLDTSDKSVEGSLKSAACTGPVSVFGDPVFMQKALEIAADKGIPIVENILPPAMQQIYRDRVAQAAQRASQPSQRTPESIRAVIANGQNGARDPASRGASAPSLPHARPLVSPVR